MANVTADLVDLYVQSDALALADLVRRGAISQTELV